MKAQLRRTLCFSAILFFSLAVSAQAPAPAAGTPPAAPGQTPGGPMAPRGPRPKPTNIQALPKDISGDDVIKAMREYEGALGVECAYCHAPADPVTHRADRASDANPLKDTARVMIRMTADINAKYLAELGTGPHAPHVGCATCHRGQAHPPVFVPKPEAPRPPAAPATTPPM